MNKYTEDDYKKKCNELNLKYLGFHSEKHKGTMIEFICPVHNDKGVQLSDWSHFKNYSKGCPYCTGRYRTQEEFISLIANKNVEPITKYLGNEKPVTCRCRKCGFVWTTVAKALMTNGAGCPKCGKIKASNERRKTTQQFIKELKEINPYIEIIGEYNGYHEKIKCRCLVCNKEWDGISANLLNNTAGCPYCTMSNPEREMILELERMGFNIKRQYSFPDCKYIYRLKFDAFDIENNIAFEYNGEQHYFPLDKYEKGEIYAQEQYLKTVERDKAKADYCREHHIPLIIIPYWERKNIKEYLIQQLSLLRKDK